MLKIHPAQLFAYRVSVCTKRKEKVFDKKVRKSDIEQYLTELFKEPFYKGK